MEGFEVGERYETMGLRANDLRKLHFNDVRVPAENVLGEPGEGFRIAMQILNNGRMSLGSGSVGGARKMFNLAVAHTSERRQFGQPLADFELVREKIGWMTSYLYGLESMGYMTTGLVDRGVSDYSLESAICKVAGTEFTWYQANRALQLAGGEGYMRDAPYEKTLRDLRIFPIFEGANDVMRAYIALNGFEPLSEYLSGLEEISLRDPIRATGVFLGYVARRIEREVVPERLTRPPQRSRLPGEGGVRAGQATAQRDHRAALQAPQGGHLAPARPKADRRLGLRHLRADLGDQPDHRDAVGRGRRRWLRRGSSASG